MATLILVSGSSNQESRFYFFGTFALGVEKSPWALKETVALSALFYSANCVQMRQKGGK